MNWNDIFEKACLTVKQQYKSGETGSAIETMQNCIDSVFGLISNIQDPDEQNKAANEVVTKTKEICEVLIEDLNEREREHNRQGPPPNMSTNEIKRIAKQFFESLNWGMFCISKTYSSLADGVEEILGEDEAVTLMERARRIVDSYTTPTYNKDEIKMLKSRYKERITQIREKAAKRRFDEYWDAHQEEKAIFESEKQSLNEKITALNQEIPEIPQKTDGYTHMVELQKKVQNLISERKAFGFFKFKEKWAVQKQINAVNSEIAPIRLRIKTAVKAVENLISQHKNRIKEIDHELIKPR